MAEENIPIMRERTPQDDFWSSQYETYKTYEPAFNLIKDILTVGGGLLGGGGGSIVPGPGTAGGALLGAGLGRAGGQSIKDLFANQLGYQTNLTQNALNSALEGSTMEAGGQALGSAASRLLEPLKEVPSVVTMNELPNIKPGSTFHGGLNVVEKPSSEFTKNAAYSDVFHTSRSRDLAEQFSKVRQHKRDLDIFNEIMEQDPELHVAEYVEHELPEGADVRLHNVNSLYKVSDKLGIPDYKVQNALEETIDKNKWLRGENVPEPEIVLDAWHNLLRDVVKDTSMQDMRRPQEVWGDLLRGAGIRRITSPYTGVFKNPGATETMHFYPGEDLTFKPTYDMMKNQNALIQNERDYVANTNANLENKQALSQGLMKALGMKSTEDILKGLSNNQ